MATASLVAEGTGGDVGAGDAQPATTRVTTAASIISRPERGDPSITVPCRRRSKHIGGTVVARRPALRPGSLAGRLGLRTGMRLGRRHSDLGSSVCVPSGACKPRQAVPWSSRLPLTGSPTSPPCSRRAATRSGAGAPTSGSAAATGRTRRPPANRAALEALTGAAAHPAPGLVAYRGDRVVGWVSLGPREDYERLAYSKVLAPVDDTPVWSIVCFVVSRRARGQGVAAALLDAADRLRPRARRDDARGLSGRLGDGRVPAANAFHGTLAMFERAGFTVVERRQWNDSTPGPPDRPAGARPALTGATASGPG